MGVLGNSERNYCSIMHQVTCRSPVHPICYLTLDGMQNEGQWLAIASCCRKWLGWSAMHLLI